MRKIKFRGLKTDGTWIFGSLVIADSFLKRMPMCHTKTWIVSSAFGNGGWFNIRTRAYVNPETVGQFTGLQDKNGVDIYCGDIVDIYCGDILGCVIGGAIAWCDKGLTFAFEFGGECSCYKCSGDAQLNDYDKCDLEVIGNIHQNKELVK